MLVSWPCICKTKAALLQSRLGRRYRGWHIKATPFRFQGRRQSANCVLSRPLLAAQYIIILYGFPTAIADSISLILQAAQVINVNVYVTFHKRPAYHQHGFACSGAAGQDEG